MLPVDENHQTLCAVLTSISDRSLVGLHKADKTIRGPPNFKLTSTFYLNMATIRKLRGFTVKEFCCEENVA